MILIFTKGPVPPISALKFGDSSDPKIYEGSCSAYFGKEIPRQFLSQLLWRVLFGLFRQRNSETVMILIITKGPVPPISANILQLVQSYISII